MNKSGLTRRLAKLTQTTNAEAADYLDAAVLSILKRWKHGEKTNWPGLGVFAPELSPSTKPKKARTEAP